MISMCGVAKVTMCLCDVAVYSQEVQLAQEVLLHPEEENNNYKQSKGNLWIYAQTCGKKTKLLNLEHFEQKMS